MKKSANVITVPEKSSAIVLNPDFSMEVHLAEGENEDDIAGESTVVLAVVAGMISNGDTDLQELIMKKIPQYLEIAEDDPQESLPLT